MTRLLLHGATVYSDADPFATAMLVEDGTIAWLGDEETARAYATGATRWHLPGTLVAPGFVDVGAGAAATPRADLVSRGVLATPELGPGATVVTGSEPPPPGHVAVVDPRELPEEVDLGAWARDGVPLALASAAGSSVAPWELLRHALARGLSARAAFLAHTRGPWRASAVGLGPARLRVGEPASFVVWDGAELVTQVASLARSAWSVDAAGAIPPLPRLGALEDAEWRAPEAAAAVLAGQAVYLRPGFAAPES